MSIPLMFAENAVYLIKSAASKLTAKISDKGIDFLRKKHIIVM